MSICTCFANRRRITEEEEEELGIMGVVVQVKRVSAHSAEAVQIPPVIHIDYPPSMRN